MKDLFTSIGVWAKSFFKEDSSTVILREIIKEASHLKVIEKNFKDIPGSKFTLRNIHLARLQLMVFSYSNLNDVDLDSLIHLIETEHKDNIALNYLTSAVKDAKGVFINTYRIECFMDKSSHKISEGVESYEYFFLFSSKLNEGFNMDDFINRLNTSTNKSWAYKQLCCDGNYIVTTTYRLDTEDGTKFPEKYVFEIELNFIPYPNQQIIKIT